MERMEKEAVVDYFKVLPQKVSQDSHQVPLKYKSNVNTELQVWLRVNNNI